MASENHRDQGAAKEGKPPKDLPPSTRPAPPINPPILNDGLESLRSGDC